MGDAARVRWCVKKVSNKDALKRICSAHDLRQGGNRSELNRRVWGHYGENISALLADLKKPDLRRIVEHWAKKERLDIIGLSRASRADLEDLARCLIVDNWTPGASGEGKPLRGRNIRVCARGVGELLWEDDGEEVDVFEHSEPEVFDEEMHGDDEWGDGGFEDEFDELAPDVEDRFEEAFAFDPERARLRRRPYQDEAVRAVLASLDRTQPKLLHVATGGGKTWIANDAALRWFDQQGGPVLWITKDWSLLWQAAQDISRRYRGGRKKLSRIGGERSILSPIPEGGHGATVVYTTIQTLGRRILAGKLGRLRPSLVVWDECHWGQSGKAGRLITKWCSKLGVPLLGLTATPRSPERSVFEVVYRKTFPSLVADGYLAHPRPELPVETGIDWTPERMSTHGDFSHSSLRKLAKSRRRNELIVEHYAKNARKYGKTIVFACNIDHANRLATLFNRREGVAARPIHSAQDTQTNADHLDSFRRGSLHVLVNVAKLTHGIDVPSARTVFLCRPTLSDILFSQMVGRAARRTEEEDSFFIVEFTDNIDRHGDDLVLAKAYFEGAGLTDGVRASVPPPPTRFAPPRHAFDPLGAARFFPVTEDVDEALRGLWYRDGQTFGLELELTSDPPPLSAHAGWMERGQALLDALRPHLPPGAVAEHPYPTYKPDKNSGQWNLEYDSTCGWEVTSRILSDAWGYEEVLIACRALGLAAAQAGLRVNYRTGLHLHVGWLGQTTNEVRRAIKLARFFEPALATLVSPSRLAHFDGRDYDLETPNEFCQPVATVFPSSELDEIEEMDDIWALTEDDESRYVSFNVLPLDDIHTVEVRLHNGTVDGRKIVLWVSLWQQILGRASTPHEVPDADDTDVIEPDGDIVKLAREHLPGGSEKAFLAKLDARREQIAEIWRNVPELSSWTAYPYDWGAG